MNVYMVWWLCRVLVVRYVLEFCVVELWRILRYKFLFKMQCTLLI